MERTQSIGGLVYHADGVSLTVDAALAARTFEAALKERFTHLLETNEELAALVGRLSVLASLGRELPPPAELVGKALAAGATARGVLSIAVLLDRQPASLAMEHLDWSIQQALERECPTHLPVPTGNRIRLDYTQGARPILAVRLQELFGLAETPCIAGGRVPVLLHLLAPNHRPVQVTSDLRSFWNTTYAEVRKELRARYPKHAWPEDPWTEPPTARTKKQRGP
jgi:ATP-dependent helicase HrpB